MMRIDPVRSVQAWYPQIYLACHLDHKRGRTSPDRLSPRDSAIRTCGERERALEGLALLARAARELSTEAGS